MQIIWHKTLSFALLKYLCDLKRIIFVIVYPILEEIDKCFIDSIVVSCTINHLMLMSLYNDDVNDLIDYQIFYFIYRSISHVVTYR
jgi:hypothetical protein